ncbi:MAG: GNAT family N-acetyltransferase, partial [Actinomycetota bacterium]
MPAIDSQDVDELVPRRVSDALVAVSSSGRRLGAAWLLFDAAPLVPARPTAAEVCMALEPDGRNRGVGTALLNALIGRAAARDVEGLVLNVHLREHGRAAPVHEVPSGWLALAEAGSAWPWRGSATARERP